MFYNYEQSNRAQKFDVLLQRNLLLAYFINSPQPTVHLLTSEVGSYLDTWDCSIYQ